MVSRRRWEAALSHRPGPHPPGKRGPKPLQGKRQRRLQAWAERPDTPWETVAVDWDGGQRRTLWGFPPTARWHTPGLPPLEIRVVSVCDAERKLRMEAFCCPGLQATPGHLLAWVVMRWSVEVTGEEGRTQRGLETQRHGSDQAIACTTPVRWALCSLVTVLALQWSQDGQSRYQSRHGITRLSRHARLVWPWFAGISGVRGLGGTLLPGQSPSHCLRRLSSA
jgi:hypothetical protein